MNNFTLVKAFSEIVYLLLIKKLVAVQLQK